MFKQIERLRNLDIETLRNRGRDISTSGHEGEIWSMKIRTVSQDESHKVTLSL